VEIFGLNFTSSYQHAFVYIRQLAIHLRNAITQKTKMSYQNIYNWQFINSIKVWALILSSYPNEEELTHLVYPLVQVLCGTIRLIPTSRYFPVRFICIRALNQLAASTNYFVNTAPYILEVLDCAELNKKSKMGSSKPMNFSLILKVPKAKLHTRGFQDSIISQLYEVLLEYFSAYSCSIGFPELILPTCIILKKFLKNCKVPPFKKKIQQLLEQVEKNKKFVLEKRNGLNFTPKDSHQTKNFLVDFRGKSPLNVFFEKWRNEESAKKLLEYEKDEDGSMDESDFEEEEREVQSKKRKVPDIEESNTTKKKEKKVQESKITRKHKKSQEDIVEDFVLSD